MLLLVRKSDVGNRVEGSCNDGRELGGEGEALNLAVIVDYLVSVKCKPTLLKI